jgi:hypothetical protein
MSERRDISELAARYRSGKGRRGRGERAQGSRCLGVEPRPTRYGGFERRRFPRVRRSRSPRSGAPAKCAAPGRDEGGHLPYTPAASALPELARRRSAPSDARPVRRPDWPPGPDGGAPARLAAPPANPPCLDSLVGAVTRVISRRRPGLGLGAPAGRAGPTELGRGRGVDRRLCAAVRRQPPALPDVHQPVPSVRIRPP